MSIVKEFGLIPGGFGATSGLGDLGSPGIPFPTSDYLGSLQSDISGTFQQLQYSGHVLSGINAKILNAIQVATGKNQGALVRLLESRQSTWRDLTAQAAGMISSAASFLKDIETLQASMSTGTTGSFIGGAEIVTLGVRGIGLSNQMQDVIDGITNLNSEVDTLSARAAGSGVAILQTPFGSLLNISPAVFWGIGLVAAAYFLIPELSRGRR